MNWTNSLPFNWFDVAFGLMLFIGYSRGKKNGMSQESVAVLKWVAVVLVAAIAYEPLAEFAGPLVGLSKLSAFVLSYILVALVVAGIFVLINRSVGEKLKGSDTFGKAEFYLAMPAGMLRFACVTLMLLALLNARFYSTAEVKAEQKYQNDNYGSNFFPTLCSMQDDVFIRSAIGKQVKEYLSFLLIKPTPGTPSAPAVARRQAGF